MNTKPSPERSNFLREVKLANREKTMVAFVALTLLFYFLALFAPFGVYVNIFLVVNKTLPVNISLMEYLALTLAMVFVVPVFISRRRKLAQFKTLNNELLTDGK